MKKLLLAGVMLVSVTTFAQTKKVIIEDYTGTWCGWCPEGTVVLEGLEAADPNIIPLANHNGDALQTVEGAKIDADLSVTAYPNGSIDRVMFPGEAKTSVSRGAWANYAAQRKAVSAIVSVSFDNKHYDPTTKVYSADINFNFTSAPNAGVPVVWQCYVIEDSIAATGSLAQSNYSSNVQGGASPLNPWYHNATLRQGLATNPWGDPITSGTIAVGTKYTQSVSFTVPSSWDVDQIHLLAFASYNGTVAAGEKEIMNSEEARDVSKTFHPVSVNNISKNVEVLSAYPNPASLNSIVKVQYDIAQNAEVSMKVYSLVGQLVAQPVTNSNEVAGSHVIHWRPSDNSLTPGIYLIEISTQHGKEVQKINVY